MAVAATVVQTFWRPQKRPTAVQFLFNLGSLSIAIAGSSFAHGFLTNYASFLGAPAILALTGAIYFLLNTAPVGMIVSLTEGGRAFPKWRTSYAWTLSFYIGGMSLAGMIDFASSRYGWQVVFLILPMFYAFARTYQVFLGRLEDSQLHAQELAALQFRSIQTLARAVEAQDETTHSHLHRVETYATELGRDLGLSGTALEALKAAAILHDVGKLAVPEHIISKPGKLSAEEFETMKIHTIVGGEIVEQIGFPFAVAPLVRAHHEKWDGSGYPDGLAAEAIPLGARILSVVDCFDALVADRQYRRALPLDRALDIVAKESGKAFDPQVVDLLQKRYVELEVLARNSFQPPKNLACNLRVARGMGPDAGLEVVSGGEERNLQYSGEPRIERLLALVSTRSGINSLVETAKETPAGLRFQQFATPLSLLLGGLIPHDSSALFEVSDETLRVRGAHGKDSDLLSALEVPMGHGVAGWVARNRKPIVNADPSVESGAGQWSHRTVLQAALAIPLVSLEGLAGVLVLYRCEKDSFNRNDLKALELLTARLAEVFLRDDRSARNAGDEWDRAKFFQALAHATREESPGAPETVVIRIDLEEISAPDPAAGQPPAESFEDCVRLISESFPAGTCLARLSRTEFAVLSHSTGTLEERLQVLRSELFRLAPDRFNFAAGMVRIEKGGSVEDLLASAECALRESPHNSTSLGLRRLKNAVEQPAGAQALRTAS